MICHHYKCLFVHIPKNAGQSVEHVFLDALGLTWETRAPLLLGPNDKPELGPPRLAHLLAREYVECKYLPESLFSDYFKFTFVRNPWSRMVSFYKYLGFNRKCHFRDFLVGPFRETTFEEMAWFVGPQSHYVCSREGELLVDYVGRFENLQADFDEVCRRIQMPPTRLPHVNRSKEAKERKPKKLLGGLLAKDNKSYPSYQDYRDYYDQECIDLVAELYRDDIERFAYDF